MKLSDMTIEQLEALSEWLGRRLDTCRPINPETVVAIVELQREICTEAMSRVSAFKRKTASGRKFADRRLGH